MASSQTTQVCGREQKRRWICISLFTLALTVIATLLGIAISIIDTGARASAKDLWNLGFGQVHARSLITGWSMDYMTSTSQRVTACILIANLPQAILSFLYLTLNGLLTAMFLGDEWSHFADERKSLKVSNPKGSQRKTYFLQLPYRVAVPLMIMSGLLHWLVSQSFFLAVVAECDEIGRPVDARAITTCGFSPFAMIFVLLTGTSIIVLAIALEYQRSRTGIPLVGSCSLAISAACHGSEAGSELMPLLWVSSLALLLLVVSATAAFPVKR